MVNAGLNPQPLAVEEYKRKQTLERKRNAKLTIRNCFRIIEGIVASFTFHADFGEVYCTISILKSVFT